MAHVLKLYIQDNNLDSRLLIISDLSLYDSQLAVSNNKLFIQLPGFTEAKEVTLPKSGTVSCNSVTLGLSTDPQTLNDLPDGLYTITYSVAPNKRVYTVMYHFRTSYLENQLYACIADLKTSQNPDTLDASGNNLLSRREEIYTIALLLLEGLKGNMILDKDLAAATAQYQEIEKLIAKAKIRY